MEVFRTPYIYTIILALLQGALFAQEKTLNITSEVREEKAILSALVFDKVHSSDSLAYQEALRVKKALEQKGYLELKWKDWMPGDSSCLAVFNLGPRTEEITIYLDSIPEPWSRQILRMSSQFKDGNKIILPFEELPGFLQAATEELQETGHPFARIQLDHIELAYGTAKALLLVTEDRLRTIDKVVIRGYEDFPSSFLEHRLQLKLGSTFNRQKLDLASKAVNNLDFAEEVKAPEVLFSKDSTIIYLYLRKKKANALDGLIGFASESQGDGLELNGYLDLQVRNLFNGGESLILFWKSNGNDRQRFFLEAETPYLFKTPLVPKIKMEIYRQDSTYSNVLFQAKLGYALNNRLFTSLLFSTENSNDLNKASSLISSYQNYFAGASLGYLIESKDRLFPKAFELQTDLSLGSRNNEGQTTRQGKFFLSASYLLPLGQQHFLHFANTSAALKSEDYLENELFRIGGINNLRGVNEESIFASLYSIFNLEYRYKTTDRSYFFTITDAAYVENRSISENTRILSLGLGYSFTTIMGRVSFSYANGKFSKSPFNLENSKVHIKIINEF